MILKDLKKIKLPDKPGVYFFYSGRELLYIGKATSLRSRVASYFGRDLIATRGPLLVDMVTKANKIKFEITDSVLEALILEANLIKKHQPKYNTKEKDNKSFNYVCISCDVIPKVLTVRGRSLDKSKYKKVFGPFPNGLQLREAMKIIRRIFPYVDDSSSKKQNVEFYKQLGLVPDTKQNMKNFVRVGAPVERVKRQNLAYSVEYRSNIKNLILFFEGKKKNIISSLKKEMMTCAKLRKFEQAGKIKRKIFALEHINDVALIKEDPEYYYHSAPLTSFQREVRLSSKISSAKSGNQAKFSAAVLHGNNIPNPRFRIEAYDIAHMSGKNMVGVMTVVVDNEIEKSEYKKFIIRTQSGSNDTGALDEVLSRRFRHTEWGMPDLIVMDGSTAQVNVAKRVLDRYMLKIPVVGVVKDDKHKAKAIMGDERIINKNKKLILLANAEAHRFAINFHKNTRNKNFLK